MRKLAFLAAVFTFLSLANLASAQQADAMIGFGTAVSPGAASCGSLNFVNFVCPERGGLYTNISADVIFHRRLGVGFDAAWRTRARRLWRTWSSISPDPFRFQWRLSAEVEQKSWC